MYKQVSAIVETYKRVNRHHHHQPLSLLLQAIYK